MAKQIKTVLTLDNKQYNSAIKSSQAQTSKFEKSSVSSANTIRNAFVALGGAAVIGSIAKTGASFQDLQNSLNVVFGGLDEGAAAFSRVQDFAATTQFSVQTLTQAFVQLKGAGVEPTTELLQTFADTASVTTDQMGTFQAALDLVSRSTAGGLGLEDLNRLADRGIPVFNILQERLNLTRLQVSEFGKTAQGANTIVRELLAGLNQRFGGALETQVGLLNFELNQLGDAFDKLQVSIFNIFAEDAANGVQSLASAINGLADTIAELNASGGAQTFKDIASNVGLVAISFFSLKGAPKLLTGIGDRIMKLRGSSAILGVLKNAIAGLGPSAVAIFTNLQRALASFTSGSIVAGLTSIAFSLKAAFGFAIRFAGLAGLFIGLAQIIDAVVESFTGFSIIDSLLGLLKRGAQTFGFFKDEVGKTTEVIKNNAHVLAFQAEQEKIAAQQAEELAEKTRKAALAAEAFQKGFDNAKKSVESFKKEVFDTNDPLSNYQEFLSDLIATSNDLAVEQVFAGRAMAFLSDLHERGAIATRTYEIAIERLNGILGITTDTVEEDTEAFDAFNTVVDDIAKNTSNYNLLLERLIELQTLGLLTSEQYKEALANLNTAFTENEGINNFLDTLGRAQKSLSEDLAQAFMDGESAGDSFQKFFKKMIKQIIADIIRLSIIQPILGAIMAPFGFGFGTGGNVIKIPGKASGGPVMANQPYIVGEKGPELFVPGQSGGIIPNGTAMGGTSVNYTINAVDSQSFEMALARDPSFVFAVTEAGRRKLPGRV